MGRAYRNQALAALLLASALTACASRPTREAPPPSAPPPRSAPSLPSVPKEGRAYRVVSQDSLLTVLVYRGGPLARTGHNHVIASRDLTGMAWLPEDPARASFEIRVPVEHLTIDEPPLRALEGPEFASDVSDSAREGTRRNMLSEPMLAGDRYPEIVLHGAGLSSGPEGSAVFSVSATVRDRTSTVTVPVHYEVAGDALRARGELRLKQTDLGLAPFSLLGGALRVEDEMTVKFSVVARAE